MGPLIRKSQRVKVDCPIGQGRGEGARLVFGGGRPAHLPKGIFTDIALFDEVENRMAIAQEEVFGPDWLKEFTQKKSIFYPVGR